MTATISQTIPREQLWAYVRALKALAEAIREAGPRGIASGLLYSVMQQVMTLDAYNNTIALMISSGVIRKYESGILVWIAPMHSRD